MRRLAALYALLAVPLLAQYRETVTVARILVDVRVTDFDGDAFLGLEADDFEVFIGGKKADVLSASWIADSAATREIEEALDESPPDNQTTSQPDDQPPPAGRLFVFFIQTDFAVATERTRGQMHFFQYAEKLLEMLEPGDRAAVFSFDSHLKFRRDFTSDKSDIIAAMHESMIRSTPGPPRIVHNPALASRLDREAMKKAADSETALLLIGNALRPIPGPKTLLLMGWGLGELSSGMVHMKKRYAFARNALEAARVTIFALDTTYADYHSLEVGLGKAAKDTGGFYAKTHIFPTHALERLRRTLAGHYELELRRPDGLKPGTHKLEVRVKRRDIHVLAPSSWMDR